MKNTPQTIAYVDIAADPESSLGAAERSILDRINQKVAAGETLKDIIDFLFNETRAIMPCDRIGIGFLEENNTRLTLYYVVTSYTPVYLDTGYSSDIRGSSLSTIFNTGTPRVINDLAAYYNAHPGSESSKLLVREGVLSSMTCPLIVENRPVGLLFRSSRQRAAYSAREIKLHLAIAERLGQAVEKAFRIEQLSAAFNSYMEMLGFVTHELKSPLSSIIMLGATLTNGYMGALDEKQKETVERMIKKAEYLITLTGEYLNLSRFESGKIAASFRVVDFVADIVNPAIDIVGPQLEANRITLETFFPPGDIKVECDPELLRVVIVNLAGNAVKYGNVHGIVRISITADAETLKVSVWNTGPGFSESEKKNLFKKFSRIQTPELMSRKGSGVGLYMCWKIVTLHGGQIRADSTVGEWAEFTFEIPLVRAPL